MPARRLIPVLAALGLGVLTPAAHALDLQVNTTADLLTGTTYCQGTNPCSLREAIQRVNADASAHSSEDSRILVPAGTYNLTRRGAPEDANQSGDLDVNVPTTYEVSIRGDDSATTILDGQSATTTSTSDRVLHLNDGKVRIDDLTIRNGAADNGAGVLINRGSAFFSGLRVVDNRATNQGGGIADYGQGGATLSYSLVARNTAASGGGFNGESSGVDAIDHSVFDANRASSDGGGAFVRGNDVPAVVSTSLFTNNVSGADGGGLSFFFGSKVDHSSFVGNAADGAGGGVDGQGTVSNVALLGNTAKGTSGNGRGGGGHFSGASTLTAVTFARNAAGGTADDIDGTAHVKDSILAEPQACPAGGTIVSDGHNLDAGKTCGFTGAADVSSAPVALRPPGDYGGPDIGPYLAGYRLLVAPPATGNAGIDAGAACPADDVLGTLRPQGAACDIGAVEALKTDLVAHVTGPATVAAGAVAGYDVTVDDAAAVDATAVTVLLTVPGGSAAVTGSTPAGACTARDAGVLACALGTIAHGKSAGLHVDVRLSAPGPAVLGVQATSDVPESDPADNAATATTVVSGAPDQGGPKGGGDTGATGSTGGTGSGGPAAKLTVALRAVKATRKAARTKGVPVTVTLGAPAPKLTLTAVAAGDRKQTILAKGALTAPGRGPHTVTLKPTAAGRKRLAGRGRLKLTVIATASPGGGAPAVRKQLVVTLT